MNADSALVPSIRATYDSTQHGLPYRVTTYVGDAVITYEQLVADPFGRTEVVLSWRDVLRQAVRWRRVRVAVVVSGDRERVHDVLELDDQQLIPGRTRHAAFHAGIRSRLAST